jgi:hypothetical protein
MEDLGIRERWLKICGDLNKYTLYKKIITKINFLFNKKKAKTKILDCSSIQVEKAKTKVAGIRKKFLELFLWRWNTLIKSRFG